MHKKYLLVSCLLLVLWWAHPVNAAPQPSTPNQPETRAKSMLILDESGKELAVKNADEVRPIASLTKLMTAMVLIDSGLDFSQTVTYTPKTHYAYKNYMNIKRGEVFRATDLWYAMLAGSMNIETRMLVAASGIPERTFVDKMNIKASVLGLEKTKFVNVTGLPPDLTGSKTKEDSVSTARELAQLFYEALKYPAIADALSKPSYTFTEVRDLDKKPEHSFSHTNYLYKESLPYRVVASKTGYTEQAGACFITKTKSRAGEYTVVTLGDKEYYRRFDEPKRLAEWALMHKWVQAAAH